MAGDAPTTTVETSKGDGAVPVGAVEKEKKDEVNAGGNKIGADELSAVTQLFTEDYMVDFLLDNTLGAWWAGRCANRAMCSRRARVVWCCSGTCQ